MGFGIASNFDEHKNSVNNNPGQNFICRVLFFILKVQGKDFILKEFWKGMPTFEIFFFFLKIIVFKEKYKKVSCGFDVLQKGFCGFFCNKPLPCRIHR